MHIVSHGAGLATMCKILFLNLEVVCLASKVTLYSEPKTRRLALLTCRLEVRFFNVKICFNHKTVMFRDFK